MSTEPMTCDVVVAGAGPAGSATARDIARAGFRVVLLEEHEQVGRPTFCAGVVSPRTLELAGVSAGVVLNALRGARVHSASGKELSLGGDKVRALAIDRAAFDQQLVDQAQEAGAELLLGSRLVNMERQGERLRLGVKRKEKQICLETKLLIGADGAHSRVARWINGSPHNSMIRAIGTQVRLRTEVPNRVEVFVGQALAPGWFGWCIPLDGEVVRIGLGAGSTCQKPLGPLLHELMATFPSQFQGAALGRLQAHAIPLYSPTRTYGDRVLLVGDAARQVKPTSGGGLYTGLVGAKHCARVAVEALHREDLSEAFLSQYEAAWKGEIGQELEREAELRKVFLSLTDQNMDRLLAVLGTPPLPQIINQFGDTDFQSPLFGQLAKIAPLLRLFVRGPLSFLPGF